MNGSLRVKSDHAKQAALLDRLLTETPAARIYYEFIAVRPGLLKEGLPERIGHIRASASDYLVRGGLLPLKIIGS